MKKFPAFQAILGTRYGHRSVKRGLSIDALYWLGDSPLLRAKLPIESSVDHDARLVTFRVSGRLATKEMLSAVQACFAQRQPGVVYDVLSDHRGIEKPATPDQIKTLIAELMRIGEMEGMRAAIIVGTDASYGMMRMMSAHAEALGIHVGIFREPADALKFLSR